jgi:hypothetical protein
LGVDSTGAAALRLRLAGVLARLKARAGEAHENEYAASA